MLLLPYNRDFLPEQVSTAEESKNIFLMHEEDRNRYLSSMGHSIGQETSTAAVSASPRPDEDDEEDDISGPSMEAVEIKWDKLTVRNETELVRYLVDNAMRRHGRRDPEYAAEARDKRRLIANALIANEKMQDEAARREAAGETDLQTSLTQKTRLQQEKDRHAVEMKEHFETAPKNVRVPKSVFTVGGATLHEDGGLFTTLVGHGENSSAKKKAAAKKRKAPLAPSSALLKELGIDESYKTGDDRAQRQGVKVADDSKVSRSAFGKFTDLYPLDYAVEDFADGTRMAVVLVLLDIMTEDELMQMYGVPRTQQEFLHNQKIIIKVLSVRCPDMALLLRSPVEWCQPPVPCPETFISQLHEIWKHCICTRKTYLQEAISPETRFFDGVKVMLTP